MKRIAPALLLSLLATGSAGADQPVPHTSDTAPNYYDFTFIFTNASYDNETITGVVRGLAANGTSAAYSVEILGTTGFFGVGEYVGNPMPNEWTLVNGAIESVLFVSNGAANNAPDVTDASLIISSVATTAEPISAALDDHPFGVGISTAGGSAVTFRVLRSYDVLPGAAPETLLSGAADALQGAAAGGGVQILSQPEQIRLQSQ